MFLQVNHFWISDKSFSWQFILYQSVPPTKSLRDLPLWKADPEFGAKMVGAIHLHRQIFQNFKETILGPFFPFQFLFVVPLSSQKIGQDHHHFIFVHLLI